MCVFNFACILLCIKTASVPAAWVGLPSRPPYGHLEALVGAVCEQRVFVCLAGHERRADDVRSPWVMFRQSSARSGNHPVYGPYVNVAQRRMHSTSVGLARHHTHTHTSKTTRLPSKRGSDPAEDEGLSLVFLVFLIRSEKNPTSCCIWPRLDSKT